MPVHQLDEFKTRQRAVWDTGEYGALSPFIADVGELVVARATIEPGMSVLDVACGTGNAARPAARAGAQRDRARSHTQAAGGRASEGEGRRARD